MVVKFEGRANLRLFEFVEVGIIDHKEGIVGVDIFDLSLLKFRATEQACVVKANDRYYLVGAAGEPLLHGRCTSANAYILFDLLVS